MKLVIVKQTPEYRHAFVDGQRVAELLKNGDEWVINPCVPWLEMVSVSENKVREHICDRWDTAHDNKGWIAVTNSTFEIPNDVDEIPLPKETKIQKKIRKQITRWMKRKK